MTLAVIFLVRHCEAAGQEPDAPLTDAGLAQAEALAGFLADLGVDAIFASEFLRARQTAWPLAQALALPVVVDRRLNERTLSPQPVPNWQDIVRDSFDDHDFRAPGGESANDVLERAWPSLDDVLFSGYQAPAVVTHGNLLSLVLHSIDETFGFAGWRSLTNPDVYRLEFFNGKPVEFERLWDALA